MPLLLHWINEIKINYKQMPVFGTAAISKENIDSSVKKEVGKLKMELADREFEIKKLVEDHALIISSLRINAKHQKMSLLKLIRELNQKVEDDNQAWAKKVEQIRLTQAHSLQLALDRYNQQLEIQRHAIQRRVRVEVRDVIFCLEKEISRLSQSQLNRAVKNQEQVMVRTNALQIEKQEIITAHKLLIVELEENEKQKLKHEKSSRKAEEEVSLQLKQQCAKLLALCTKDRMNFDETILKLTVEKKNLRQQLNLKTQQVENIQQTLKNNQIQIQQTKSHLQQQFKQMINDNQVSNLAAISELETDAKVKIELLQQRLMELEKVHFLREQLWEERGKKILYALEERESKEVKKKIQNLEIQLLMKENEFEREKEQVRCCKLQLNNMEEVYQKLFTGTNKSSYDFKSRKVRLPYLNGRTNLSLYQESCRAHISPQ